MYVISESDKASLVAALSMIDIVMGPRPNTYPRVDETGESTEWVDLPRGNPPDQQVELRD